MPAESSTNVEEGFDKLLSAIMGLKIHINTIQQHVRSLERTTKKQVKRLEVELGKRKKKRTREPSGFAKPMKVSDKLCDFLEKPRGSEIARTEVTQYLISYIKDNGLQNEDNKKLITPDMKLNELLELDVEDDLSYFNIQKYMNKHFIKEEVSEA
jgi:upstream activation factor subunit UAF30